MAGYVIADIEVLDPERYRDYLKAGGWTVAHYGGSPLAVTRSFEVVEGETRRTLQVLLKFDSVEAAKRWYDSPEYQAAIPIRQEASRATLVIVEGSE